MKPERILRNDSCPCGSGLKFKKCCYGNVSAITALDRAMAIELLEQRVRNCEERLAAQNLFYGDLNLDEPAVDDHFKDVCESAFVFWFAFDYQLKDGSYLVDRILKTERLLSAGERQYLQQMKGTAIVPYEVVDVRPGTSVVLRMLGADEEVEVREKTGSRNFKRWDLVLVRLNSLGPTGGTEIEMGAMFVPPPLHQEIAEIVDPEPGGQTTGEY